jgi:hypothetical protein
MREVLVEQMGGPERHQCFHSLEVIMQKIVKNVIQKAAIISAMMLGATAVANAGAWADFHLHNNSSHSIMIFQTKEGGAWGKNWLGKGDKIKPGAVYDMNFGHNEGPCTVQFHVEADDGFKYDYEADFCKATNLYITNSTVKYD